MEYNDLLPINTTEKVDLLIIRLKNSSRYYNLDKLEIDIIFQIRKLKVQLYFKECFTAFKQGISVDQLPAAYTRKNNNVQLSTMPDKGLKEAADIARELVGLSISEIEKFTDLNCSALKRILLKHEITATDDCIFNLEMYILTKDYLCNLLAMKSRSVKLSRIEQQSLSSGFEKRNYKFAPSYGKEGNYYKLILIQPKS
ncbi:hypothetical protein DBR43_09645 [Pedobacter sp. KBW06]|uniref:hypothetical protein n=1 Tax=Pedobacter sp. KBW06 TaxID=2153359 RepID=UPI000F590E8A|nr:hypothetical protein [Pedobacter sp. KBW06]RQO75590.1 hypothetical protein DBR43_09645 [Pedobacter sp. KBW06]